MDFNAEDAEIIRSVEQDAWFDIFEAAPPATANRLEMKWERSEICGLLACRRVSAVAFNRAFAVGRKWASDPQEAHRCIEWVRRHGAPTWVVQIDPDGLRGPSLELSQHGLRETGQGWAKLLCPFPARPLDRPLDALVVRVSDDIGASVFASLVCDGFGFPDEAFPWFRSLALRPRWNAYLGHVRGQPVSAGAMYLNGKRAWLGVDTTLRPHRGQGLQAALIHRRLEDCARAGIEHAVAETGRPLETYDPSESSYRNYVRSGFKPCYCSVNLGRPGG